MTSTVPFSCDGIELSDFSLKTQNFEFIHHPFNGVVKIATIKSLKSTDGNQARDHLSNERTFLAYLRTSLNLFFLALLLIQLTRYSVMHPITANLNTINEAPNSEVNSFLLNCYQLVSKYMKPISGLIFTLSIIILTTGIGRYWLIKNLIQKEDAFEELRLAMLIFISVMVVVCATIFAFLFNLK